MPLPSPPPSGSSLLAAFQQRLEESAPEPASFQPLLRALREAGLLEAAFTLLKRRHPGSSAEKGRGWGAIRTRMELAVGRARETRAAQWQLDPRRLSLRLRFEVRGPAVQYNPSAQVSLLSRAFLHSGLPIAMGLEKTPRPVVHLGPPLPLGVEGLGEWADALLRETPSCPLETLPVLLNHHLPEGLRILDAGEIPAISSPVLDLAREARWEWPCPEALREPTGVRLAAFMASDAFQIEKTGKLGGHKVSKRIEVRPFVLTLAWEGPRLVFATRLDPGAALNPQKLLAGILGLESGDIRGLVRTQVLLDPDPKLDDPYRYELKLSNLYEDAVLLGGSGPQLVDEDDDEPLALNR
jgi:radical SAM-linked protein